MARKVLSRCVGNNVYPQGSDMYVEIAFQLGSTIGDIKKYRRKLTEKTIPHVAAVYRACGWNGRGDPFLLSHEQLQGRVIVTLQPKEFTDKKTGRKVPYEDITFVDSIMTQQRPMSDEDAQVARTKAASWGAKMVQAFAQNPDALPETSDGTPYDDDGVVPDDYTGDVAS